MKKNMIFERLLRKSVDNTAAVITIPRPVAQMWSEYDKIVMEFDGESLVVTPKEKDML
jgi:hypothetical protein